MGEMYSRAPLMSDMTAARPFKNKTIQLDDGRVYRIRRVRWSLRFPRWVVERRFDGWLFHFWESVFLGAVGGCGWAVTFPNPHDAEKALRNELH